MACSSFHEYRTGLTTQAALEDVKITLKKFHNTTAKVYLCTPVISDEKKTEFEGITHGVLALKVVPRQKFHAVGQFFADCALICAVFNLRMFLLLILFCLSRFTRAVTQIEDSECETLLGAG
jgi:hypothetical protein